MPCFPTPAACRPARGSVLAASLALLCLVAACGGGGGDDEPLPADGRALAARDAADVPAAEAPGTPWIPPGATADRTRETDLDADLAADLADRAGTATPAPPSPVGAAPRAGDAAAQDRVGEPPRSARFVECGPSSAASRPPCHVDALPGIRAHAVVP